MSLSFASALVFLYLLSVVLQPSTGSVSISVNGLYDEVVVAPGQDRTEYVYQTPPSGTISGVIFLAHGCNHRATDWFPQSSTCTKCTGLIVEREITYNALSFGLVAVAISSRDTDSMCWSKQDISPVMQILEKLYRDLKLDKDLAPLFMLGASSGGSFVGSLAAFMIKGRGIDTSSSVSAFNLKSVCIQISNIMKNDLSTLVLSSSNGYRTSPISIAFNHMPRDSYTARGVQRSVKLLRERGISVLLLESNPTPLRETFFSDHRGGVSLVSPSMSKLIVQSLLASNFLDFQNNLVSDPRESDWRAHVEGIVSPFHLSLGADKSNISELLNIAYAAHEITDYKIRETLEWMITGVVKSA